VQATEAAWIEKFIRHLTYERRLSALTSKNYRRDLNGLADYCDKFGIVRWADLDDDHVRSFAAQTYRRGLSPRSIQRQLSAARTFFRYLQRERHVKKNPVLDIRAPKSGKRLPENLDADRMARLLDIPGDGPLVARDRAILELLYSSGLRLAELTGLNIHDVDLSDKTVAVTGKGGKDRIIPVGRFAIEALTEWKKVRGTLAGINEQALFVSTRGTRISARSVQARVDHWAKRQGIDTRVYPHLFSHDLRGVQELLGHANISTTQVYTHLDFQHLAQIYDKTHPRARAKNK
jgi:integrase/recombinase XerC